jgi:hypothetical protein
MTNQIMDGIINIGEIEMKNEKKKLIEILYKQLKKSGNFEQVDMDSFSDGSASWIDCYHTLSPDDKGYRYMKHLSFNGEGTILEDVQVWRDKMYWDDDESKQLR